MSWCNISFFFIRSILIYVLTRYYALKHISNRWKCFNINRFFFYSELHFRFCLSLHINIYMNVGSYNSYQLQFYTLTLIIYSQWRFIIQIKTALQYGTAILGVRFLERTHFFCLSRLMTEWRKWPRNNDL